MQHTAAEPSSHAHWSATPHSAPPPEAGAQARHSKRGGRWQLILLALLCIAPIAASYFTYYVIRPGGRTNFGTLIEPQRPLPAIAATDRSGRAVDLGTLKGQWLLLSVADAACDAECQGNLYLQRQLREAMGKNMDRVDWVWLVDDDGAIPAALEPALTEAMVLRVPRAQVDAWLPPEPGHRPSEHLYVVDPMGHLMMRFPAGLDKTRAAKAKRDLSRLLRASASWDSAGRGAAE